MNGYRYWVERHKLLVELAEAKQQQCAGLPAKDAAQRGLELELAFRARLDALYGEARDEFESRREPN